MTCCWLHRDGDALLALGGKSRVIYIVSIAQSSTLRTLWGHTGKLSSFYVHNISKLINYL